MQGQLHYLTTKPNAKARSGCLQIYPSWWGEHQNQLASQHDKGPEQQPRPPPRLAYSLHQKPKGGLPLHSNDLITTEYLDVPSSGYGSVCGPRPAGQALVWEGSEGTTRPMPGVTQPILGKENSAGSSLVLLRYVQECLGFSVQD